MTLATRFIGFCPVCERRIKVRAGRLVHHGYERPGKGYIVGDCFGVDMPPHELSSETADAYLQQVVLPALVDIRKSLTYLRGTPSWLWCQKKENGRYVYEGGAPVQIKIRRDEYKAYLDTNPYGYQSWEDAVQSKIYDFEGRERAALEEVTRLEELVKTWTLQPLQTVEEEIEQVAAAKRERQAVVKATRDQRIADAVISMQKRLDSAVRNKSPGPIEQIFQSSKLQELSGYRLSRKEALQLVDRDHVWRAFGLLTDEGYIFEHPGGSEKRRDHPALDALARMQYQWGGKPIPPWPEALGGGMPKKAK